MPILTNTTDRPIEASTGHRVPPLGTLSVTDATLDRLGNEPYIRRQFATGKLTVEPDAAPEAAAPITRETIAKARRSELLDIILAHYPENVTEDDFEGITVEDKDGEDGLRTIAARIVFADV